MRKGKDIYYFEFFQSCPYMFKVILFTAQKRFRNESETREIEKVMNYEKRENEREQMI